MDASQEPEQQLGNNTHCHADPTKFPGQWEKHFIHPSIKKSNHPSMKQIKKYKRPKINESIPPKKTTHPSIQKNQ